MNIAFLGSITFSVYLVATFALASQLHPKLARQRKLTWLYASVAPIACALHALVLGVMLYNDTLDFSFFNGVSIHAWAIILVLLLLSLRWPIQNSGLVTFPIAGISVLLSTLTSTQVHHPEQIPTIVQLHIVSSIFAYSLLIISALQAVVLSIQDYRLHNQQTDGITHVLPPLKVIERLMFRIISMGFILLTVSGITGFFIAEDWWNHKNIFSLIAWSIFALLLFGRWKFGWRGRRAVRLTFSGTIFLILAYFGSKMVLELILGQ